MSLTSVKNLRYSVCAFNLSSNWWSRINEPAVSALISEKKMIDTYYAQTPSMRIYQLQQRRNDSCKEQLLVSLARSGIGSNPKVKRREFVLQYAKLTSVFRKNFA